MYFLVKNLDKPKLTENMKSQLQTLYESILHLNILEPTKLNHVLGRVYMDILSEIITK